MEITAKLSTKNIIEYEKKCKIFDLEVLLLR